MYFWDVEKLKEDFKKQAIGEGELFKYLTATSIVYFLGFLLPYTNDFWYSISMLFATVITIFGLYYTYRCNGGKNGNHFLDKYIALGWVVSLRWAVLVVLPLMAVYFILAAVMGYTSLAGEEFFFDLLYIYYFWLLGKHVKDTI